jgi:hypothetical protein
LVLISFGTPTFTVVILRERSERRIYHPSRRAMYSRWYSRSSGANAPEDDSLTT